VGVWLAFLGVWWRHQGVWPLGLWESLGIVSGRYDFVGIAEVVPVALSRAALVASEAGALLLIFAPVPFLASSFAAERETGTLESLLLTSTHHNLLVRGRFWSAALPWFRLALYLLPLYALVALEPMFTMSCSGWSVGWLNLLGWLVKLGKVPGTFVWAEAVTLAPSAHSFFLAGMRWLHDLSAMALAMGAAFWISLRARTTIRATVLGFLAVPPALLVAINPEMAWLLVSVVAKPVFLTRPVQYYWTAALAIMALRWGVLLGILRRASANLDAYVLGEKPDPLDARPRVRGRRRLATG
jgi:hypothetical protein